MGYQTINIHIYIYIYIYSIQNWTARDNRVNFWWETDHMCTLNQKIIKVDLGVVSNFYSDEDNCKIGFCIGKWKFS